MTAPDLYLEFIQSRDARLGRHVVHDPRSWEFRKGLTPDTSTWNTKHVRIYDPTPNPNQTVGNCTCCAQAMLFNTTGNRRDGVRLDMAWAMALYPIATRLDNIPGEYPAQDTGSSGLAACKASQQTGDGGEYNFLFGGVDEVVQAIQQDESVALGTVWTEGMFQPDANGFIAPTGKVAGGHEYVAHAYIEPQDALKIRCWWGPGYRDVLIKRADLGELLANRGDAHTQKRVPAAA